MLKSPLLFLLCLLSIFWTAQASSQTEENQTGWKYVVDKYFSVRGSGTDYSYSKSISLYSGLSFYRENTEGGRFDPYSSLLLGINQKVRELPYIGDINLSAAIFSTQMERQKAVLIEFAPRISFPSAYTGFPLYVGAGAGVGFYPGHVVKKLPSLSLSGEFFAGLRFFNIYHNVGAFGELNLRMHFPFKELNIYLETFSRAGLIFRF